LKRTCERASAPLILLKRFSRNAGISIGVLIVKETSVPKTFVTVVPLRVKVTAVLSGSDVCIHCLPNYINLSAICFTQCIQKSRLHMKSANLHPILEAVMFET
jgi:hypothetical protein